MMFIWTAKPGREESIEWHVGEPLRVPDASVVNFQASGDELDFLIDALRTHGARRADHEPFVFDANDHPLQPQQVLTCEGSIASNDGLVTIDRLRYLGSPAAGGYR